MHWFINPCAARSGSGRTPADPLRQLPASGSRRDRYFLLVEIPLERTGPAPCVWEPAARREQRRRRRRTTHG